MLAQLLLSWIPGRHRRPPLRIRSPSRSATSVVIHPPPATADSCRRNRVTLPTRAAHRSGPEIFVASTPRCCAGGRCRSRETRISLAAMSWWSAEPHSPPTPDHPACGTFRDRHGARGRAAGFGDSTARLTSGYPAPAMRSVRRLRSAFGYGFSWSSIASLKALSSIVLPS